MLRTILVGLDESPYSAAAVELGAAWAKKFDALLVGIGVVDEPTMRGPEPEEFMQPSYAGAYAQMMSEAGHRVDRVLERFTLRCNELEVSSKLLEDVGLPHERILLEAQRYDLVLVGQKTFFHFETSGRACDTLDRLLKATPRPVVVVPKDFAAGSQQRSGLLIAYDGSVQSARALFALLSSGLTSLGPLYVMCAHGSDKVEAAQICDRAIEFLRFHKIEAQAVPTVSDAPPSQVIVEQAHALNVEMIVMGAYGRGTLAEFFIGSHTKGVLEKTDLPVFLFH